MKNRLVKSLWLLLLLLALPCLAQGAVDADGKEIPAGRVFSRIISLYPAHTENLFNLGLDKEIIGVSASDDFPAMSMGEKPRYSYREDAEKIIAARPDLVLIRPMIARGYGPLLEKLALAGITVISLQPDTVEEMFSYWRTLGELTGRTHQAETVIRLFKEELDRIREMVKAIPVEKRKKVYFEAIHSKMKTFAPSSMTIFALTEAGGINIANDAQQVRKTNIADYGKEHILSKASEIDVFLAQHGHMNSIGRETIIKEPGFQVIKAIRDGEVHLIDEQIVSRPTPRLLDGIKEIGRILYPDIFGRIE